MINCYTLALDQDARIHDIAEYVEGLALCPYCGIRMHLATSRTGTKYFAAFPHEPHKNPYCQRAYADHRRFVVTDACMRRAILAALTEDADPGERDPGAVRDRPAGDRPGEPARAADDDPVRMLSSLRAIAANQLHRRGGDYRLGATTISDWILSFGWAGKYNCTQKYRGETIVHARLNGVAETDRVVFFRVSYRGEFNAWESIKIRTIFPNVDVFYQFLEDYCRNEERPDGSVHLVDAVKGREYYIAGVWDAYTDFDGTRGLCCAVRTLKQIEELKYSKRPLEEKG